MSVQKGIKLFEINFSDSDEEDSFEQSQKDQSMNVNSQIRSNIEQDRQYIRQIENNSQCNDQSHNLQTFHRQNHNDSIFQIDFNPSCLETPPLKYHSTLRKIKRLPQNNKKQISSVNSPFIAQFGKNSKNKNQQTLQKRKKLTNQKQKIQKFNQSFQIEDLEEIKLETILKRSDTSTTDQSLKDTKCIKQKIIADQLGSNNQEENQHSLFSQNGSLKENRQNSEMLYEQVQNHLPLFRQFRSFSFDSQLTQSSQIQQRYEGYIDELQISNQPFNESQCQISDFVRNQEKKDHQFSVLSDDFSSEKYSQKRKTFLHKILNPIENNQGINQFLTTQILENQMFEFQVHVYKDLFKTQYQLWIKPDKNDDESVLIANASNDSFHIDRSTFIINRVNAKNQKEFIGQLESNFTRDFYSLNGYRNLKNDMKRNQDIYLHEVKQIMNMSFTIDRVAYLPKSIDDKEIYNVKKSLKEFIHPKSHRNLKQKYQAEKFTQQNTSFKLIPSKNIKFDKDFYRKFGIRDSKKTCLMEDSTNHNKLLFIGKIASKKYKILVGQGLSPLQALGMLISHVEVN